MTPEEAAGFNVGDAVKADLFAKGQLVDVTGITKGRGFQGVMKRWNFKGSQTKTHGTHEYRRHPGAIGQRKTPGRVYPNKKMPGHYGVEQVTTQNLTVVDVDVEKGLLLIKGARRRPQRRHRLHPPEHQGRHARAAQGGPRQVRPSPCVCSLPRQGEGRIHRPNRDSRHRHRVHRRPAPATHRAGRSCFRARGPNVGQRALACRVIDESAPRVSLVPCSWVTRVPTCVRHTAMNARNLPRFVSLALLLTALSASAQEQVLDPAAVRHRLFSPGERLEASFTVGLPLREYLTAHYNLNAGLAYNFFNTLGVEARAGYALSRHTGLARSISESFLAREDKKQTDELEDMWEMNLHGVVGARWAPIYGKLSLLADETAHFQAYLWAGGGLASLRRQSVIQCTQVGDRDAAGLLPPGAGHTRVAPVATGAMGFRFFLSNGHALRFELRDWVFADEYRVDLERELLGARRAEWFARAQPGPDAPGAVRYRLLLHLLRLTSRMRPTSFFAVLLARHAPASAQEETPAPPSETAPIPVKPEPRPPAPDEPAPPVPEPLDDPGARGSADAPLADPELEPVARIPTSSAW